MPSKYEALAEYLSAQPGRALPMTFAQVQAIVGELPPSAWKHRAWWSNSDTYPNARSGWLAAGWMTTKVDMQAQRLLFVRRRAAQPPTQPSMFQGPAGIPAEMRPLAYRRVVERPEAPLPPEGWTLTRVVEAAGGETNLAEVARAIQRYVAGEIVETELGRVIRMYWGRRE